PTTDISTPSLHDALPIFVETKQWNADLGPVEDAVIGQKISSAEDRAGLGTGYTYFSNARFNPFIYNRERFAGEAIWDRENPPGPDRKSTRLNSSHVKISY